MSDSVGSVSVEVVPDARGWSEKLRSQIRDQSVKIKADAETEEANAKIDETARNRTSKIKVKTDTSELSKGVSKLDDFVGKLGLLPALALTVGAALIPLAGALGGIAAALAAPLAIAGGGATLFALLGGAAIKQTQEQLKQVDQLHKSVESARTSLDQAQRSAGKNAATSTSVANAQDRLTQATAAYHAALKDVSPQQKQFAGALDALKSTFGNVLAGPTGRALLKPFTDGLNLLTYAFKAILPIVRASAGAFSTMLEDITQAMSGPGFARFVNILAHQVGPDLVEFGRIAGNGAKGIGGLFLALDRGFGHGVLDGLLHLSHNFADLGANARKSGVLKDFVDYFHKVGPQVASTIGAVARAIGHIVQALAPLGPPVLNIIEGISNAFSAIPIPVLTALAAATGGLIAFQKVGGFKATSFALGKLGGGAGGGPLANALGGVQKVYVVNLPPGGGPGGIIPTGAGGKTAAGEAGLLGRVKNILPALAPLAMRLPLVTIGDAGNETTNKYDKARFPGVDFSHIGNAADFARATAGFDRVSTHIRSVGTSFDAMKARGASASRQIDQIGPQASASLNGAIHSVGALQARLAGLHDKHIRVIADTLSAIASLERLQAMRIADKHFTVYQRNQIIERGVGPGGGIGISNPGGSAGGGSGGGAGVIHTHVHLDRQEIGRAITPFMDAHYEANKAYDDARAGR